MLQEKKKIRRQLNLFLRFPRKVYSSSCAFKLLQLSICYKDPITSNIKTKGLSHPHAYTSTFTQKGSNIFKVTGHNKNMNIATWGWAPALPKVANMHIENHITVSAFQFSTPKVHGLRASRAVYLNICLASREQEIKPLKRD